MSAPIDQILDHLAACRQVLEAAYAATQPRVRELAPPAGGWSIAQIIEHLAITDDRLTKFLAHNIQQLGRGEPEDVDVAAILQKRRMQAVLDRGTRVDTLELFAPNLGLSSNEAWALAERNRAVLVDVVRSAAGVPLSRGKFSHHVLGEMNLYETLVFAGYHEQRHAEQIREVATALERTAARQ